MVLSADNILLVGSVLIMISIMIGNRASKSLGMPLLYIFLMLGILFGKDGLGIDFSNLKTGQRIGDIALCIILFSGGLNTRFKDIRPVLGKGVMLASLGTILTALVCGAVFYLVLRALKVETSLPLCFLAASVLSSTDSAAVFNVLRHQSIKLKHGLSPMLELESGSNDPFAFSLTLFFTQLCLFSQGSLESLSFGMAVFNFILEIVIGGLLGLLIGKVAVWMLQKIKFDEGFFYPIMVLSLSLFVFSLTRILHGNSFLAVYICAIVIGNNSFTKRSETFHFIDGIAWIFQIVMFLMLGLLASPSHLIQLPMFVSGVMFAIILAFIARPAAVFISLLPFRDIKVKDKIFVSWVGLKGAGPILFGMYPLLAGIDGGEYIFDLVFIVTILSMRITGGSLSKMARRLNLDLPMTDNDKTNIPSEDESD